MNTSWWRSAGRILWWIFTRIWVPLMAIGWPVLATYGAFSPNSSDLTILKLGRYETAILVGTAGGGSQCDSEGCVEYPAHRSYVIFPTFVVRPSAFVVEDGEPPRVEEEAGAAIVVIAIWLACLWGTWHYWVRPSRDARVESVKRNHTA